jgi:hypothetical protein
MAIARRHLVMIAATATATATALSVAGLVTPGASAGAAAPAAAGAWERAIKVPGLAALQSPNQASLYSISCASGGDCAAVGQYDDADGQGGGTGYIVSEHKGTWGKALNIPGLGPDIRPTRTGGAPAARALAGQRVTAGFDSLTAIASSARDAGSGGPALIPSGASQLYTVSCGAPGDCAAGGYVIGGPFVEALMVSERHGIWRNAIEVASQLNVASIARVWTVSCPSAGNCAASGTYSADADDFPFTFLVSESDGAWRSAIQMPGAGTAVNSDPFPWEISCSSAGNCAAGGSYYTGGPDGTHQAFLVSERGGTWRPAFQVPGLAALNAGGSASIETVSCPSAGNCAAGGYYEDDDSLWHAFVVGEQHGVWGQAMPVIGTASPSQEPSGAAVDSISCASEGNCTAGGYDTTASGAIQAIVLTEHDGRWGRKSAVLGNPGQVISVSCSAPGSCAAGGYYIGVSQHYQAFVADQRHGRWSKAIEVPGTARLNRGGNAAVNSVSCPRKGPCSAAGYYFASGVPQPFLDRQVR